MSTYHVASYVIVGECVTVMVDHLSSSHHSLSKNRIGNKGAIAVAEAVKTANNVQMLK